MGGILKWEIKGCLKWQKEGLKKPELVIEATDDYKTDVDQTSFCRVNYFKECLAKIVGFDR